MTTTKNHPAYEFADCPRFKAIDGVFTLIASGAPANECWAQANKVMQNLNDNERERMPDLVKMALKERDG